MALFQTSVLNNYLKRQNAEAITKAYKKFAKYFLDTTIQQNIRESKEEQFQEGFLRELFVTILGYTLNPHANFDLTTELKNEKGAKKADGAILKNGNALGVIELKSTKTKDLESIRQQAFDYKANQTDCVYVVTSNFEKLRFYVNNAVEFEEFDLFTLNQERFALLYLCLEKENLLQNIPLKIKEESIQVEEQITKKFYGDYSLFKRELYRDLVKLNMKNEVFRVEFNKEDTERANKNIKQNLFKKSQKLIDRFLFIFFAEDRNLLPPNSTVKILEQWNKLKELDEEVPLYDRYKKYFNYLDTGRKGTDKTAEIFAYNGGLFKPDAVLDSLLISDELLYKHTNILSIYDFQSQVDVNILGHIFENSLNEIESVNAEIEGVEFDAQKTKRKKDGVFYTPKYITKYIVENTVGKLCTEKKAELEINEEEYTKSRKGRTTAKLKELKDQLENYRNWLLQITICDPACGSGAFLNQALDFLIKEHQYIDELQTSLLGGGFVFPDIENTVLENNIFGVDLNEESVEIAKLSLWLRTAQPRRKLNDLNNNIKCGNSLIDNKAVAGDKAFKWQDEFTHVFAKGGFDVVIGNPPYVFGGNKGINDLEKQFFKTNYVTGNGKVNLFTLFIEKSNNILKNNGEFSFIIPNTFLRVTSYHDSRRYFIENFNFRELADIGNDVFAGAVTSAIILLASKSNTTESSKLKVIKDFSGRFSSVALKDIIKNNYLITSNLNNDSSEVLNKITLGSTLLGRECKEMIFGVVITKNKDEVVSEIQKEGYKPFLEGKDISSYYIKPIHQFLNYSKELLHRARTIEVFEAEEKLLVQRITGGKNPLKVAYDNNKYFNKESINNIILNDNSKLKSKYVLCILNSSLINWYYNNQFTNGSTLTVNISKEYLSRIPIKIVDNQELFIIKADLMLSLNKDFHFIIEKFNKYIQSNFQIETISSKIQNFYSLDFNSFIKELNTTIKTAKGTPLTKLQEMEWMEVFETKKAEAQTLKAEIDKTDKEIDKMVYKLYGLSEEEIKIVEGATV
ncbi:MAG: hypothetical protein A3K10_16160 [Bacteroidetes bacterium RIFCSPLOWO2_12_FULL_31_6]|nr:MAG: hypothetical protein A3K10_16160 [Bacteroidetes bacterium RIFCSPLOWO2_12_FULL_31_6]